MLHDEEVQFHQLSLLQICLNPHKNIKEEAHHLFRLYQLTGDKRFKPEPIQSMPQSNSLMKQTPKTSLESTVLSPPVFTLRLEDFGPAEKPNVRFSDICGLSDAKEAIKLEMVYPKIYPEKYEKFNKTPGAGILLWGPPGCGKTMVAKAVATEIDALFVPLKSSDIMSKWVGESEKKVSDLFKAAREHDGDVVLFFDEFDSLVPRSGPSYVKRVKNQFLAELDGIDTKRKGLLILAATNAPFYIDSAVRRPGRFEKTIFIPSPDHTSRTQIFELNLLPLMKNGVLNDGIVISDLAEITEGYSGADIKAICDITRDIVLNEALRSDVERKIRMEDFCNVIKRTPRSIIPWINDALRAARRFGEESYYPELQRMAEVLKLYQQYDSMR